MPGLGADVEIRPPKACRPGLTCEGSLFSGAAHLDAAAGTLTVRCSMSIAASRPTVWQRGCGVPLGGHAKGRQVSVSISDERRRSAGMPPLSTKGSAGHLTFPA